MGWLNYETETLLATRQGGFFDDAIAIHENQRGEISTNEMVGALNKGGGKPDQGYPCVAIPILEAGARTGKSTTDIRAGSGIGDDGDPMFTLQRGKQHAIAFGAKGNGGDASVEISPTLRAAGHDKSHANGGSMPAVAFNWNAQVDQMNFSPEITPTLTRSQEAAIGPVAFQTRIARNGRGQREEISPTLNGSDAGATSDMRPCVQVGMAVRRLTPRECERLQGFPDHYTDIPVGKKNKMAPDGPRYEALGNSMAVPCMAWIGRRIKMLAARTTPEIEIQ